MERLKQRVRPTGTVLLECIEGGIIGGLNKLDKWEILPHDAIANEEEAVRIITNYIMANIEEEFDLD